MRGQDQQSENGAERVTPRHARRWRPELGTQVPPVRLETTRGTLDLLDWAKGQWLYVFAFPSTFASVCSTELIAMASHAKAFEALGVKAIGVTPAGISSVLDWVLDLEKVFGLDVSFPVAGDEGGAALQRLGLMGAGGLSARPSLFVDPEGVLRMYIAYPARMGRSTEEVLRCFEGLKDVDYSGLAIPADWQPGDDLVAPKGVDAAEMQRVFGEDWSKVSEYLLVAHIKE